MLVLNYKQQNKVSIYEFILILIVLGIDITKEFSDNAPKLLHSLHYL